MSDLVGPVSSALLHFVWQGTAIALALALILRVVDRAASHARYALCCGALAALALAPLITAGQAIVEASDVPAAATASHAASPDRVADDDVAAGALAASEGLGALVPRSTMPELQRWVVWLWLAGVLGLSLSHAGGWWQLRRWCREATPPSDARLRTRVAQLGRKLGLSRAVTLLESTRVDVPTVIGWLKPVVLVPSAALLGLSPQALDALLLHELAHVRRRDYLVNLLQAALETLLFYHPAVWWVSRQVRNEREHCCDDIAVALCGSRRAYLRALLDLEELRVATPRLAVAADGGSLVERIRRLTRPQSSRPGLPVRRTIALFTLLLAALVAATQVAVLTPVDAGTNAAPETRTAVDGEQARGDAAARVGRASQETITGTWSAQFKRDRVWLELDHDGRPQHGNYSIVVDPAEFGGTGDDGIPGFWLRRDAGTFQFEGRLGDGGPPRRFEFRPNPDYAGRMADLGFEMERTSLERHYSLAALDVSLAFAADIRDAGHGDVSMQRLMEFRIHGVSGQFIRAMEAAGYPDASPRRLVAFRIHGVSPDFVRAMADTGLRDLSEQRLIEFRIHGVTPEFVRDMADVGLRELSPQRLVQFRIHGVSPDFVRAMRDAGMRDLTPQRLVELRIHNVVPDFMTQMTDLGLELSERDLVQFRIHGVSPEFIRGLRDAGVDDLDASRLVQFRIHQVSPELVRELTALGLRDLSPSQLVQMRIHHVTPEFVRRAQQRHGSDLTADELIEMRIHRELDDDAV